MTQPCSKQRRRSTWPTTIGLTTLCVPTRGSMHSRSDELLFLGMGVVVTVTCLSARSTCSSTPG
eukprot:1161212-Pelagomonas_calceolata.AAC.21